MINVKGIQIGNLFRDKLTGEMLSVCSIDEDADRIEFKVVNRENYPLPDGWQAEPIPLTENILKQYGFEKSKISPFTDQGAFVIDKDAHSLYWCAGNVFKYTGNSFLYLTHSDYLKGGKPAIELLHQLQNLYLSLSGKYLEAK